MFNNKKRHYVFATVSVLSAQSLWFVDNGFVIGLGLSVMIISLGCLILNPIKGKK